MLIEAKGSMENEHASKRAKLSGDDVAVPDAIQTANAASESEAIGAQAETVNGEGDIPQGLLSPMDTCVAINDGQPNQSLEPKIMPGAYTQREEVCVITCHTCFSEWRPPCAWHDENLDLTPCDPT